MANSQFATRREVIKKRSAFYINKLSYPRYAIFLWNAFAQQTMTVKLVSLAFEPFEFWKRKKQSFSELLYGSHPWTHCIPHQRYLGWRGDITPLRLKAERSLQINPRAPNSESVAV